MRMGTALSVAAMGVTLISACNTESSNSVPAATPPAMTAAPDSQKDAIAFNAVPLGEALSQIQRHYNITVDVAPPELSGVPITASFQRDVSPTEVLGMIATSLNLEMTQADSNRYVISKPRAASQ
jgi:ferric-dicitrate binding protein FerR (iron transport regulator)